MELTHGQLLDRRESDLFYDLSDDTIRYLAEAQIKADKLDELLCTAFNEECDKITRANKEKIRWHTHYCGCQFRVEGKGLSAEMIHRPCAEHSK